MDKAQIVSFNKDMLRMRGKYFEVCPDSNGFINEESKYILCIPLLIPYCLGEGNDILKSMYQFPKAMEGLPLDNSVDLTFPHEPDYLWNFSFHGLEVLIKFVNYENSHPDISFEVFEGRYSLHLKYWEEVGEHTNEEEIKAIFSSYIPCTLLSCLFKQ